MGCCGGRDKEGGLLEKKEALPVVLARDSYKVQRKSLPERPIPFTLTSKFDDIETYALSLLDSPESWESDLSDPHISIKHLPVTFIISPQSSRQT